MHLQRAVRSFPPSRRPAVLVAATVTALMTLAAGCSSPEPEPEPESSPESAPAARSAADPGRLPSAHIHGVAMDPGDGALLLASHDGLFEVGAGGELTPIGPVIDLMGFAVSGADHYLASGHPGPGVDLPEPVGLIESTDGGATWTAVSRQGESDFHALTVSGAGALGYDGALMRSADGRTWEELDIPAQPHTLAASPDGRQILATTQQGLLRSTDAGSSWSRVDGAPLLQVVDWADEGTTVAGVDPAGVIWTSTDAAGTWQEGAQLGAAPHAIAVTAMDDGRTRIAVVTTDALLESQDGGRTFTVVLES